MMGMFTMQVHVCNYFFYRFVNGADAKQLLMGCGLPQPVLAQIWALVDIGRTGRLNLEQFALVYVTVLN